MQDIIRAVVKTPGMAPRQIGDALGLNWTASVSVMSALLQQLCKAGKLERKGKPRAYRYYPTDLSLLDMRSGKRMAKPPAKPKPARVRKAAVPKPALSARKPQPKPTAAQQLQIVPKKPDVTTAAPPRATRETVDEFLRRGGRIERLPNGASADPLRITRADIDAANWRRREQRNNESP